MKGYQKGTTWYKYEKETGKLRLGGGSWTINLDEIPLNSIENVIYITPYAKYEISLNEAMMRGFQKKFKNEQKLVVPIKHWKITFKQEGVSNG